MIESPYLTADEAVQYLRMSWQHAKKVLLRRCRRGEVNYYRIGREYRFRREDLDAFMALNGSAGLRKKAQQRKMIQALKAI